MSTRLYDFYQQLKGDGILFCFSGPISQDIMEGIGGILRFKMKLDDTATQVSQRVFATFVEQMQNVINYSAEFEPESPDHEAQLRYGIVVVGKRAQNFYVHSGNFIQKEQTAFIINQIEKLNTMTPEELKAFYRAQRRLDPREESKGAGLGLIEMARKASGPLKYSLFAASKTCDFISIEAEI
jgi:hypothetical protein